MSAASLASYVIGKLSTGERTRDDMTDRGQEAPTPKLTVVWRAKSIPYDISDAKSPFKSHGSLLKLLRTKSMPQLGQQGGGSVGMAYTSPTPRAERDDSSLRSESPSPTRCITSRYLNQRKMSGQLSDASESTIPCGATPPPTPRSPSPDSRSRSASDGHLWQKRKRQLRNAREEKSSFNLPSVKTLKNKFDKETHVTTSDEHFHSVAEQARGASANGYANDTMKEQQEPGWNRRRLSRHNSLPKYETTSPERRAPLRPMVTPTSIKRLLEKFESPTEIHSNGVFPDTVFSESQKELRLKSRSEVTLMTMSPYTPLGHGTMGDSHREGRPKNRRSRNLRRARSEPDPSAIRRHNAQTMPVSVRKLKKQFEKKILENGSPGTATTTLPTSREKAQEVISELPHTQKLDTEISGIETQTETEREKKETVDPLRSENVSRPSQPAKLTYSDETDHVISTETPSVRSLRRRFEEASSTQSYVKTAGEDVVSRPRRIINHELRTPFENHINKESTSASSDKGIRLSVANIPSSSVQNLLRQFEALSPDELQTQGNMPSKSPSADSATRLKAQHFDHTSRNLQDEPEVGRFPHVEDSSKRRLWRQPRTFSSESSSDEEGSAKIRGEEGKQQENEDLRETEKTEEDKVKERRSMEQEDVKREKREKEREEYGKPEDEGEAIKRTEQEMQAKEKAEQEEKEREKIEQERKKKEEKAERERKEREKAELEKRERERQEKERKDREIKDHEEEMRRKAEGEQHVKEKAEKEKDGEGKLQEQEQSEILKKEALEMEEQENKQEKIRRDELTRRISEGEMMKTVEVVENTRKEANTKEVEEKPSERKVQHMIDKFANANYRSESLQSDSTPEKDVSEKKVGKLIDQFKNIRDMDFGETREQDHAQVEDRRSSDVATLVGMFANLNVRRPSSCSSEGDNSEGKAKDPPAAIPTISTKNAPGKVRTLRADELRFFEAGNVGEPFTRSQSLRTKKNEPSPFLQPRFGSVRDTKSRVAILSSTDPAKTRELPRNCRYLNTDELKFFTGEVTNIYKNKSAKKESKGEKNPPSTTMPDTETFFRLRSQDCHGGDENRLPGDDRRFTSSHDDSDSESSVLRGYHSNDATDSEEDIYEIDITLRSEDDEDDLSDTEHDLSNPLSLLMTSLKEKLLQPVGFEHFQPDYSRHYVVHSGDYLSSSDEEEGQFPIKSQKETENVPVFSLTENETSYTTHMKWETDLKQPSEVIEFGPVPKSYVLLDGGGEEHTVTQDPIPKRSGPIHEETKPVPISGTYTAVVGYVTTENSSRIDFSGDTIVASRPHALEGKNVGVKTETHNETGTSYTDKQEESSMESTRLTQSRGVSVEKSDSSDEDEERTASEWEEEERGSMEEDKERGGMEAEVIRKEVSLRPLQEEVEVSLLTDQRLSSLKSNSNKDANADFVTELENIAVESTSQAPGVVPAHDHHDRRQSDVLRASSSEDDHGLIEDEMRRIGKQMIPETSFPVLTNSVESSSGVQQGSDGSPGTTEDLENTVTGTLQDFKTPSGTIEDLVIIMGPSGSQEFAVTKSKVDTPNASLMSDDSSSDDEIELTTYTTQGHVTTSPSQCSTQKKEEEEENDEKGIESVVKEEEVEEVDGRDSRITEGREDEETGKEKEEEGREEEVKKEEDRYIRVKDEREKEGDKQECRDIRVKEGREEVVEKEAEGRDEDVEKDENEDSEVKDGGKEEVQRKEECMVRRVKDGREEEVEEEEEEENVDIISGREFTQFCIFSIWFSLLMYFLADLLD